MMIPCKVADSQYVEAVACLHNSCSIEGTNGKTDWWLHARQLLMADMHSFLCNDPYKEIQEKGNKSYARVERCQVSTGLSNLHEDHMPHVAVANRRKIRWSCLQSLLRKSCRKLFLL